MAVTFGSSLQVALFVAPVLVLLGVVIGQPMNLVFTPLEVAAVAAAVGISALIALDGESNWLEGALLMLVYADPRRLLLRVRRSAGLRRATAWAGDGAGGGTPPPGVRWIRRRRLRRSASSSSTASSSLEPRVERRLGDRLRRRRLAEGLGLGGQRLGRLLRPRSPSCVAPTASRRARRRSRSSSAARPGRRPTTGSGAGPRWRPAGPCRGTGRRSRRGGPRSRSCGTRDFSLPLPSVLVASPR